eukprot:2039197-Pyramimonas_sp.AAC.1
MHNSCTSPAIATSADSSKVTSKPRRRHKAARLRRAPRYVGHDCAMTAASAIALATPKPNGRATST